VRRVGFTLIEVMIAIGIVGILASLAIPGFSAYLYKAKFAEAYTHLGTMATGVRS
jgi:prepilin-type N-terminal cleavage/methylation domain-containing protein